jgi:TM2 domain-containing membrane protein YozV
VQPSSPISRPQQPRRSPGLTWAISLVVPGSGQIYCGKKTRGAWTLAFAFLALLGFLFLNSGHPWWGISLRTLLALYIFSFLDAYFTARELNAGKDPAAYQNPRVAAILNLLTNGFGYFYLGQRAKGLIVFVAMRLLAFVLSQVQWVLELIYLAISIDAYRIGMRELAKGRSAPMLASSGVLQLGLSEERPAEPLPPESPPLPAPVEATGLQPAVPLALAGVIAFAYGCLVLLGAIMPDYRVLDQSRAAVNQTAEERIYSNPAYGIVMHVPAQWIFDSSDKSFLIQAASADGICRAGLVLDSINPLAGLESGKDAVVAKVLGENNNLRVVGQRMARLGVRHGYEITFAYDLDADEFLMRYVLARKGMTLYALVLTNRASFDEDCRRATDVIRLRLVLPSDG